VFVDRIAAINASNELNGKMVGGCQIKVSILNGEESKINSDASMIADKNHITVESKADAKASKPEPMYSGDKVIREQYYAECKRAPKIPNTGESLEYAKQINDESVVLLLFDMLGELMRLQLRAKDIKNAKGRRRPVMGLREVCRGIRAKKVKMIVKANNLDQYGALDVKLQELLDLAKEHDLPVILELNRRKIGKALGKTIKVSVVGIENSDGAYEPFKKLKRLYG
jgi:ribosomal protein L7Ae-like RNA K-turn-binding protein